MIYKTLNLKSREADQIKTEIMFELASERASNTELVRLNLPEFTDAQSERRINSAVLRLLRNMKERGTIQFFAYPDNFENFGMESRFLLNKYPDVFENSDLGERFVYVKI